MMDYQDFIDSLGKHKYPEAIYYSFIMLFKEEVLIEVDKFGMAFVAKKLICKQAIFSPMLILMALDVSLGSDGYRELEDYLAFNGL